MAGTASSCSQTHPVCNLTAPVAPVALAAPVLRVRKLSNSLQLFNFYPRPADSISRSVGPSVFFDDRLPHLPHGTQAN